MEHSIGEKICYYRQLKKLTQEEIKTIIEQYLKTSHEGAEIKINTD